MGQITAIKPQRRKDRFNIFIDGVFAFGIDANVLLKEGLKIGLELSGLEITSLIKANEFNTVFNKALKFLSYRPRSEKEFEYWFKKKEIGEDVQKLVISKLKELKFINDEEFARVWIEQRTNFKPRSSRLIKIELRQKGISKDIIESEIFNSQFSIFNEMEKAKKIINSKIHKYKGLSKQEIFKKLGGVLARRGFSYEVIKQSIDEACKKIV